MSNLYLGTDVHELADLLTAQVARSPADFFQPVLIVTPHRYLARWLRLRLATGLGAAVNLRVEHLLEAVLWELLAQLDGRDPVRRRQLSGEEVRLMVLAALLEQEEVLDEGRRHAEEQPAGRERSFWRHTWKLADRLAGLLRDYEYHRQDEIIAAWQRSQAAYPGPDGLPGPLEKSQRGIFMRLFGPEGLVHRVLRSGEASRCTLAQYAAENMSLEPARLR
jgi:exonuclease V gamma subunit